MIAGQSLLVQGIASRLPGQSEEFDLEVLNPQNKDWKEALFRVSPNIIVLDALDPQAQEVCPLADIIWDLPDTVIMLVNSEFSELQVVSSQRFPIEDAQGLIDQILAPFSAGE